MHGFIQTRENCYDVKDCLSADFPGGCSANVITPEVRYVDNVQLYSLNGIIVFVKRKKKCIEFGSFVNPLTDELIKDVYQMGLMHFFFLMATSGPLH